MPTRITKGAIKERSENKDLQHVVLEPTDENKRAVLEYTKLVQKINGVPERIAGLRRVYRKRDIPTAIERIMAQREEDMKELIKLESILFPKKK